jgi:EmrB/QacA subfamily drug resistance transporter
VAVCSLSLFIVGIDNTIVNVALPAIQHDLHAPVSGLQWTVDAYILVIASFLMLSGSVADRFGRRRVFQTGLGVFTLGSLLCSLAPGLGWLIAFRMVQALGGSMMNPVAVSIIANVIIDPRERARALGIWGGVFGVSMALGPVVGGVLVAGVGWRGIFWVNIPIGVAAIALTALLVPESRAAHPRRLDPGGQVLIIVMLASLTYAIIEGPRAGWHSAEILALFSLSAVALGALIAYERRRVEPLLDIRFFRSAPFSGASLMAISGFAAVGGILFLSTLYLQDVRGLSALDAGLYLLPLGAMTLIFAPLSGRLLGRRGPRPPLLIAGVMMTAGALMLTRLAATTSAGWLVITYIIFGIGFGMLNAPITNTAVSGMPRARAGVAAAVTSTSRQVGQVLGVAVVGSAVTSALHGPLRTGFTQASHVGWWIVTGCSAAVLLIGLLTTGRWALATAARNAERIMADDAGIAVSAPLPVYSAGGCNRMLIRENAAPWSSLTAAIRP